MLILAYNSYSEEKDQKDVQNVNKVKLIKINKSGFVLNLIGTPLIKKKYWPAFVSLEFMNRVEFGDLIETRSESYVGIQFGEKQILQVSPNSKILFVESDEIDTSGFNDKLLPPLDKKGEIPEFDPSGEKIIKGTLLRKAKIHREGTVIEIKNTPLLKKKGWDFFKSLELGDVVEPGDSIKTKAESSAKILISKNKIIEITDYQDVYFIWPWEDENILKFRQNK